MKRHLLIQAREQRSLTQQNLADLLGVTKLTVGRWERGETAPPRNFRRKLSEIFGTTALELGLNDAPGEEMSTSLYDPLIPLLPAIQLVGREDEMEHIKQLLCSHQSEPIVLTALNGIPGVGKTALAIALAHDPQIREHFHDGVLWAPLGPEGNLHSILNHWATLLGISPHQMAEAKSVSGKAQVLRMLLSTRSMLLVIDDVWNLEEAAALKIGGPSCGYLLTTRFPHIAAQVTINGSMRIQELNTEDGMTLLRLLAPEVVAREPTRAMALVEAVGGLPLALTLIGNYLRKFSYSGGNPRRIQAALSHLSDAGGRLLLSEPNVVVESHPSLPADRHLSLQAILAVTDQHLSDSARLALYTLSILPPKPNSFSEEAALAVTNSSVEALDELADAGFLEYNGEDRYTVHQTIRDYAKMQLVLREQVNAYNRLVTYIVPFVEHHALLYDALEQEHHLITLAIDHLCTHERDVELIRLVDSFAPFLLVRGFYTDAEQVLQQAYSRVIAGGHEEYKARLLLGLGRTAHAQAEFAQARLYLLPGLQSARLAGDQMLVCDLLAELGRIAKKEGSFEDAKALLEEGVVLARSVGYDEALCRLIDAMASMLHDEGQFVASLIYLEEALPLARRIGRAEQIASVLINMGADHCAQGHHLEAEACFQDGIVLARSIGHKEEICLLLINLGELRNQTGDYVQAEEYLQEGIQIARQIGHREWISVILQILGAISYKQCSFVRAEEYLQEALSIARQLGHLRVLGCALYECGNLSLAAEQETEAEAYFQEMLTRIPIALQEVRASAHYGLSKIAAKKGHIPEALEQGNMSYTIFHRIGHGLDEELRQWITTLSPLL
jgi:tetratricopeptide (TPR) repeat protein/transcriptional regulator with XRE-family HTH domain